MKNSGNHSAHFRQSPKGVVFQEPWKPGMASTELPRLAGKNSRDGFRRFLKHHAFGANYAE
jgi:hypothetical protein